MRQTRKGVSLSSWFERRGILDTLRQLLAERSVEGYLVGGYVRDKLLKKWTHDLDLAVGVEAIELARQAANLLGGAFVLLDEERQTARVVLSDGEERYYVDFASLRGDDVETDLGGRDFTINAMAIDLQETGPQARLIDPYGGEQDLENKVVRAVSDRIFFDDPVRLLRAARLEAELGMFIESGTAHLMQRDSHLIKESSAERARDELCKTLGTVRAEASLRHLDELGILCLLIPELEALRGVEQPPPHHEDAFEHSLSTVGGLDRVFGAIECLAEGGREPAAGDDTSEREMWDHFAVALGPFVPHLLAHLRQRVVDDRSRSMLLKVAGLLHDSGKGTTGKVDEGGRIRFFGHAEEGPAVAARVLRRLRFGNREVRLVRTVISHHMRPLHLAKQDQITPRATHRFFRDTRGTGVDVLLHSLGDNLVILDRRNQVGEWARMCDTVAELLERYYEEYEEVIRPPSLVTGHDLVSGLGIEPGPLVGRLLRAIQEAQVTGKVSTKEEALRLGETIIADDRQ
ncbi:MAG: HD domain-containing protein [Anaerolineae bacterium]|nr:HD domain-containing protein [Anaerolineae bacterium]NIN97117.1 HD domain-containing protein [Anaerolineae bacterium]NIQ80090.1 HD domain-containing protein [Anaerolineae bacterium]